MTMHYSVRLLGQDFNPTKSKYLSAQKIHGQHDTGSKRRDGKVFKHGAITIEGDSISQLYVIVKEAIKSEKMINEVIFDVFYYFENQCNLEFSLKELAYIVELDATLTVSCAAE